LNNVSDKINFSLIFKTKQHQMGLDKDDELD